MASPLVSILIPCHNAGRFLRETLDSALAQTYARIEVILVDDGSTDDSLAIARSYEPRIRITAGPQQGASAARNLATAQSSGDLLQYLDADDLLAADAVASRVGCLEASGGDVACADWRRIALQPDGSWKQGPLESCDYRSVDDDPELAVFKGFWAPPAALMYRRTLVDRIGGWHSGLPVIQDARFLFDAARHGGRFVHLTGGAALYRQHASDSLSSRSKVRFWADVLTNNREIEGIWKARGAMEGARAGTVARSYALGTRVAFPMDAALYHAYLAELRRFPECPPSRYLRAAQWLEGLLGYAAAARVMRALRPNSNT
jgi:glycosyltransferase involved in cell wall biosynthesis